DRKRRRWSAGSGAGMGDESIALPRLIDGDGSEGSYAAGACQCRGSRQESAVGTGYAQRYLDAGSDRIAKSILHLYCHGWYDGSSYNAVCWLLNKGKLCRGPGLDLDPILLSIRQTGRGQGQGLGTRSCQNNMECVYAVIAGQECIVGRKTGVRVAAGE